MTDKVKVSKWFDKWIKNNAKDKNKGALIAFISPCAYHDKYFEYRINNYQFIEKQYLEIREHFEDYVRAILDGDYEVEKEKTPLGWIPEFGEAYYFVNAVGNVKGYTYLEDDEDELRFKYMRAFKTEEEAEFERERMKVTRELEKFACNYKTDEENYYLYASLFPRIAIKINFSYWNKVEKIYFESENKAKEAIKAVGEDRILKYYFGV